MERRSGVTTAKTQNPRRAGSNGWYHSLYLLGGTPGQTGALPQFRRCLAGVPLRLHALYRVERLLLTMYMIFDNTTQEYLMDETGRFGETVP